LIALCAIISGAESWTQVTEYGRSKLEWFEQFLELPNGIPSHGTFGRLFAKIDPKGFNEYYIEKMNLDLDADRYRRENNRSFFGIDCGFL
jgi:hypothetical protein